MLNLFGHSEEADIDKILAHHAAIGAHAASDNSTSANSTHAKQFRDLLQALPAAIYTTDAKGRLTFFNCACIEFAGRTPKIGDMWCVTWKLFSPDGTPLPHEECPMAIALGEPPGPQCGSGGRTTGRVAHLLRALSDAAAR